MTEKTIVECDGPATENSDCVGTAPTVAGVPTDWATFEGDQTYHFCPVCSGRAQGLLTGGRSVGPLLKVSHNYLGESFEEGHVSAGTHSMAVNQLIDEPPRDYPDYDHENDEAWVFTIYDHLHVTIIGKHKDEPKVIVESDEFPTELVVNDIENSFIQTSDS